MVEPLPTSHEPQLQDSTLEPKKEMDYVHLKQTSLFLFTCTCVCDLCMWVQCPRKPEEGARFPEAGVTRGCMLPTEDSGNRAWGLLPE